MFSTHEAEAEEAAPEIYAFALTAMLPLTFPAYGLDSRPLKGTRFSTIDSLLCSEFSYVGFLTVGVCGNCAGSDWCLCFV